MAIRRLSPTATFRVISQYDDAIVQETAEELEQLKAEGKGTRYEKYLETFNLDDLKLNPEAKPTIFVVRCLTSDELAELNEKHVEADSTAKVKIKFIDRNKMILEMFEKAVIGIENEQGKPEKVSRNELDLHVAMEIGGIISLMTSLGKNLKKP